MPTKKNFLGLIDLGGEVRRAPLVGMKLFHQGTVGPSDFFGTRPRRHAKDLIGLLFRHFAAARSPTPRCRVSLRVLTPAGLPAVKISSQ